MFKNKTLFFSTIVLTLLLGFFIAQKTAPQSTKQEEISDKIIVYKNDKKLYLFINNKQLIYPIATGKNNGDKQRVGDNKTPLGKFTICSIENSNTWHYDFGDGLGPIVGAYGPWFIRLQGLTEINKNWQGIGIHGTHDETTIGKDDTHGCIRMRNQDVSELKSFVYTGMAVNILE